jgi:O-antigen ligase
MLKYSRIPSISPDMLALAFSCLALLLLFVGRFWWPGETISWATAIRVLLLLSLLFSVKRIRRPPLDSTRLVFLLFWLYLVMNACFFGEFQAARRMLIILGFMYVAGITLNNLPVCRKLLGVGALVGGFCALISIVSHTILGDLSLTYRVTPIHGSGIGNFAEFGGTPAAGTNYAPSLVFAAWLALTGKQRSAAIGWVVCAFAIAIYVYFTYLRAAWMASLTSIVVLLLFTATPRIKKLSLLTAGIAILAIILFNHEIVLYEFAERGLTHRDEIWEVTLSRLSGHWMTGYGAGVKIDPIAVANGAQIIIKHTHNLYLEILYSTGLIGLGLMLLTSMLCVVKLLRERANILAVLWLSLLLGGLMAMLVDLDSFISSPNLVWIYFWMPVAGCLVILAKDKC